MQGSQEYAAYEVVPTSPAVSRMSGSSNLDSFRDGWLGAVHIAVSTRPLLEKNWVLFYRSGLTSIRPTAYH